MSAQEVRLKYFANQQEEVRDIDIASLQPTQDFLYRDGIGPTQNDPIEVLDVDGSLFIIDGHHQTFNYDRAGRSQVPAIVKDRNYYDQSSFFTGENTKFHLNNASKCAKAGVQHVRDLASQILENNPI